MKKHLLMLVATVVATTALIGCAGNDNRVVGTLDNRILGEWVAQDIHFGGIDEACPGSITVGEPGNEDTVSCTAEINHFTEDGKLTAGSVVNDYYFAGSQLTIYTNPRITITVTFEESDTKMRYAFKQRDRDVEVVFRRP